MSTYEAIYDGPLAATVALGAIAFGLAAAYFRRGKFITAYVALFTMIALGDALRSGPWSPLHQLPAPWEDRLGMCFVLVGDYRYFLLVERFAARPRIGPRERTPPRAWLTAFGWMLIVPILVEVLREIFPMVTGRGAYLAYELQFIVLALVWRFVVFRKKLAPLPAAVRRWLEEVTAFELGTYALWALSDILIFAGAEPAFLLRIVPNVMYYGLFVWFVGQRAPAEVVKESREA